MKRISKNKFMPKVYTERLVVSKVEPSRSEIVTKTKNGPYYKCLPVQILNGKICSGTHCEDCACPVVSLACTIGVRIGGKEEDRKVIHK